jgi:hypothetical protein
MFAHKMCAHNLRLVLSKGRLRMVAVWPELEAQLDAGLQVGQDLPGEKVWRSVLRLPQVLGRYCQPICTFLFIDIQITEIQNFNIDYYSM